MTVRAADTGNRVWLPVAVAVAVGLALAPLAPAAGSQADDAAPVSGRLSAQPAQQRAVPAMVSAKPARRRRVPVRVHVSPAIYGEVGVGQLVTARFNHRIIRKAAVERAVTVSATRPLPPGAWGWVDDRTAVYRPKTFWPGHATITFDFQLRGLQVAARGSRRYVGAADHEFVMSTGRALVLTIRSAAHRLDVEVDGRLVKTFPVSLGRRGYPTLRGIKVLTDDIYRRFRMRGRERGGGRTWNILVPYSIRLTPSGEFIHGAPWAYHRIGRWNGSHGCVNMFVPDARWLYSRVTRGDPVVTLGTERAVPLTDGRPGTYWNYRWRQWLRLSGGSTAKAARSAPTAPAGP